MPRKEKIDRIKQFGAKVIAFANSVILAQDLINKGIDAIILEGFESGGHVGPISLNVLIQEILFKIAHQIPVIVAGGIGNGNIIKHYFNMGASGVQLGTRFVCAYESPMHAKTKSFYINKKAQDTVVVSSIYPEFSVIPVRVINNKAVEEFYKRQREAVAKLESKEFDIIEAKLYIEHFWSGSLYKGVIEGDLERGSLMAGQSLTFVKKEESVQEIIESLYNKMN
jgi:enoyl-[acyl-carrier protein] reductase II